MLYDSIIILTGHKAYVGFIYLNHAYNNPIIHTFIRLLSESTDHTHDSPYSSTPQTGLSMPLLDSLSGAKTYGGGT